MKKMKTGNKVLILIMVIIVSLIGMILLIFNWDDIILKEYKYSDGNIIIDGVIYVEISESQFNEMIDISESNNLNYYESHKIGKYDLIYISEYSGESVTKYRILGNKNIEDRILLECDDLHIKFDVRNPVMYFCRLDILSSGSNLTKYKYVSDGYTIEGDGVIYEEIDEETFERIYDKLREQNIYAFAYNIVGRIDYTYVDKWKFILCGQKNQEERILLKGKELYAFYDEEYPDIYFCRQDILQSFMEDTE